MERLKDDQHSTLKKTNFFRPLKLNLHIGMSEIKLTKVQILDKFGFQKFGFQIFTVQSFITRHQIINLIVLFNNDSSFVF